MAYTFKYLMAMQFLSRGILFVFNSWIVRHLTEADYAVYAVQFQLCVTCVLFLSREGFRGACMRTDDLSNVGSVEEYATHLLKVAWMVFPIGLFFTFAGCALVFWLKDLSFSDPHVCPSYTNKWKSSKKELIHPGAKFPGTFSKSDINAKKIKILSSLHLG